MARGILNGLVALLLGGTFLFPYVGGPVTAYVLIVFSLLLIIWNFVNPLRFAFDPGSWMFLIAWVLIAIVFAITNQPGRSDYLLSVNFAMFALYPLLVGALRRFAGPENLSRVAILAFLGSIIAFAVAAFQVVIQHYPRAEGYGSNAIASATVALFLGAFALVGLFTIKDARRYLFLLGPVAGIFTVLLSQSRGPLISLPALVLIALVKLPVRRVYGWGFAAVVTIGVVATYLLKPSVFGRFGALPKMAIDILTGHPITATLDTSGNIRYAILQGSIAAFKRSPWVGYGWYEKVPVVEKYMAFDVGFGDPRTGHLHSDILNLGVSAGVVGWIAYLLVLLAPVAAAVRSSRDGQYQGRLFLALSLAAGYFCCGTVNMLFGFEFLTTMYVCFAAIFIGYCRDAPGLAVA